MTSLGTRAAGTNYEETSRYDDVMQFFTQLEKRSDLVRLQYFGTTQEGRAMPLVTIAEDPAMTARSTTTVRPARVTLTLKDGSSATAAREASVRDTLKPDPEPQVRRWVPCNMHATRAQVEALASDPEAEVRAIATWRRKMDALVTPPS